MSALAVKKEKEVGGRFRLLVGAHLDYGPSGCECGGCEHFDPAFRGKNHRYEAGDIIESKFDLEKRFNKLNSRKFERVGAGGEALAAPPAPYPLEKMTVEQLLTVAEEEEVNLKGASKKDDIIKAINAARKA